uniref:Uncharacterized LOC100177700 n=1 Tax=Ciona intestinalis TaxID=7719 RepID=F6RV80_CIOIN|nr:uncharacterized protein LOC100177700 [Ciona intestinalis]|eukprot:XP_018670832.1 uncharacterized protein LOC100177700 [Ciona intestinalis]
MPYIITAISFNHSNLFRKTSISSLVRHILCYRTCCIEMKRIYLVVALILVCDFMSTTESYNARDLAKRNVGVSGQRVVSIIDWSRLGDTADINEYLSRLLDYESE